MANRLASETSPYLLQHKDNPVDWYPWGEEALAKAKSEDKPIILSIGYSACHWCHVMEHESFENAEIARLMNEKFVSIKVDREERPDLDQIYQNVAQAMTQSGGWPLTVFLTPDLKPFFGGTYFPPEDRYGRPGFPRVLKALGEAYQIDRPGVLENAGKLTDYIQSLESIPEATEGRRPNILQIRDITDRLLSHAIDWVNGGIGSAPKFPNTMLHDFLWRFGTAAGSDKAKEAALLALRKMAQGGIYDHLGGGFHRYSVDATWSVPHFEKMLYDNALLLKLYSQVILSQDPVISDSDRELFTATVAETVQYVLREMLSPEGPFYSTQDADSEGVEGKFFVWDREELDQYLWDEEAKVFASRYGVTDHGNFEHGKTVLFHARTLGEVSKDTGVPLDRVSTLLGSARQKLFEIRERRIKPGRDEKILASWNGLMISSMAWASQALLDSNQSDLARRAHQAAKSGFDAITRLQGRPDGRLWSTYKDGKARLNAYLDDYAFMAMAALDLARFEFSETEVTRLLNQCDQWLGVVRTHFEDTAGSGYFFTSDDHEKLIQRPKTIYDQAIPSGSAVVLECLSALSEIDLDGKGTRHDEALESQLSRVFPSVQKNPFGFGQLLCLSLMDALGPVVVSGAGSESVCRHPHVFRKPASESRLLVCHQKACGLPLAGVEAAWQDVAKKLVV